MELTERGRERVRKRLAGIVNQVNTKNPEYVIWSNIKQYCYNPKNTNYRCYGARGIAVCERWVNSFETFLFDVGPRPSPKHRLIRIDPNQNYSRINCKWTIGSNPKSNSNLPEYESWRNIRNRCQNPRNDSFYLYGGRGIKVCESWGNSFTDFLNDMGPKPGKNYSIDRIDVDGDYTAENCRWANSHTQTRNKRNNVYFEVNGEKLCLTDVAIKFGIKPNTLRYRIFDYNMSLEQALNRPGPKNPIKKPKGN